MVSSVSIFWADGGSIWAQVGKYGPGQPADFTGPRVTRSVEESLQRLDTHYSDLILVHDVEYVDDLKEVVLTPTPVLTFFFLGSAAGPA
jgi:L-galactose dehydrogenase